MISKTSFRIHSVVIYVTLSVKLLKKFLYSWVPRIACTKLLSLYINYTTNGFISVIRKRILYTMLPVRTSPLRESIVVDYLVYFSSLHILFASLFKSKLFSIFQAFVLTSWYYFIRVTFFFRSYIIASWVYLSQGSCLFFKPTSSLRESILVISLLNILILHPHFTSLFLSSLLSSFRAYILVLWVYFSELK